MRAGNSKQQKASPNAPMTHSPVPKLEGMTTPTGAKNTPSQSLMSSANRTRNQSKKMLFGKPNAS